MSDPVKDHVRNMLRLKRQLEQEASELMQTLARDGRGRRLAVTTSALEKLDDAKLLAEDLQYYLGSEKMADSMESLTRERRKLRLSIASLKAV